MDKQTALEKAIEIVKEYVRGGGSGIPSALLADVYKKICELAEIE